ncbi:uncharacterized protein PG998_008065 [Apiospora kogelbergensis]|uniref:uncharacterized protein n=1 Tax=Apiospora kogelbergensis TaxID=1337665 RepID=UPI0031301E39
MEGQAEKTFWAEVADAVEDITNMADNATELMTAEFDRLNKQNRKLQRSVQVQEPERHPEGPQAQSSDIVRLEDENQKLRERLRYLKNRVDEEETLRMDTVPRMTPFFPDWAAKGLRQWLGDVNIWFYNHIEPVLVDPVQLREALEIERAEPERGSILRDALDKDIGLRLAAQIVHSEYEVIQACLLRWLTPAIFHQGYSDSFPLIKALDESVEAMQTDEYFNPITLSQWKLHSYYALIHTPSYEDNRKIFIDKTSSAFAKGIGMFSLKGHNWDEFVGSIRDRIIKPGLELQENLKMATAQYNLSFFDLSPSDANKGKQNPQLESMKMDLEWEEYQDSTDNLRILPNTFDTSGPRLPQLLAAVTPHLSSRSVSLSERRLRAPKVLEKQRRLVAWRDSYNGYVFGQNIREKRAGNDKIPILFASRRDGLLLYPDGK